MRAPSASVTTAQGAVIDTRAPKMPVVRASGSMKPCVTSLMSIDIMAPAAVPRVVTTAALPAVSAPPPET